MKTYDEASSQWSSISESHARRQEIATTVIDGLDANVSSMSNEATDCM